MSNREEEGFQFTPPSVDELNASIPDSIRVSSILRIGGMGAVYRGLQVNLHREVAVKVLPLMQDSSENDLSKQFRQEAQLMAQVQHENIVAVYDYGKTSTNLPFLVMELIEGESLFEYLNRQTATFELACEWMLQVCKGLHYLHARNIIHRDIKPSNLLIATDGTLKIADFGLSEFRSFSAPEQDTPQIESQSESGAFSGITLATPDYSAPECMNSNSNVDRRADIYSLGVIFFEMLTGELPQPGRDRLSEHGIGIDPRIEQIVESCLKTNPDERLPDALSLAEGINNVLHNSETPSDPSPPPTRTKIVRKSPVKWIIFATAMGIAALIAAVFALMIHFGAREEVLDLEKKLAEKERSYEAINLDLLKVSELRAQLERKIVTIEEEKAQILKSSSEQLPAIEQRMKQVIDEHSETEKLLRKVENEAKEIRSEFDAYREKYKVSVRKNAPGTELGALATRSGKTYQKAVIKRVTDAYLEVRHESGINAIPFPELSESIQQTYAYSPELAMLEIENRQEQEDKMKKAQALVLERNTNRVKRNRLQYIQGEKQKLLGRISGAQSRIASIKDSNTDRSIKRSQADIARAVSTYQRDIETWRATIQKLDNEAETLR